MYYACEPNTCDGFSLTTCTTGYAESDVCYTPVARYVKCDVCAEGYDYYGTNQCHKTLNCQNGSVQQGGVCVCAEGWGGVVCNVPSACEGFEYKTTCPTGYKQTDSCLSGGDTYVKCGACADGYGYYGTSECHKTLDCEHGTQRGDVCECEEGWGGTICSVPNTCDGYEYRQCPTGYKQTDSCLSGSTTYLKCEACADGYDYYGTRQCHKTLDCQNGGHQDLNNSVGAWKALVGIVSGAGCELGVYMPEPVLAADNAIINKKAKSIIKKPKTKKQNEKDTNPCGGSCPGSNC